MFTSVEQKNHLNIDLRKCISHEIKFLQIKHWGCREFVHWPALQKSGQIR
jgi:hypothetical protein